MIILLKVPSLLMRRVVLVGNVGVSLVRCRCLWLPCCTYFECLVCDVLTRDLRITLKTFFVIYIFYFNVFGWVFIGSCYVFLMGFFPRSVLWRWCMHCWERCLCSRRRSLGRYSSLEDSDHGVFFIFPLCLYASEVRQESKKKVKLSLCLIK
jgi:hypothetical protein